MPFHKESLILFIRDQLGVDTSGVDETTPLFSSGLIDSFSLVSLLTYIEKVCDFKVGASDVNLDNMDSVERILRYVESRVTPS